MTEAEWLACSDPQRMLRFLTHVPAGTVILRRVSDRKLRLFACACCRQGWHRLGGPERVAVEVAERVADGSPWPHAPDGDRREWQIVRNTLTGCLATSPLSAARMASETSRLDGCPPATQAALLRCLVGNPWRRYAWTRYHDCSPSRHDLQFLDERRRTPDVSSVARAIYEEYRWDDLPILADALEEAGCTDPDILAHCRGLQRCPDCKWPGTEMREGYDAVQAVIEWGKLKKDCRTCRGTGLLPALHVRGCWAIDLLLNKE
jgi:hypothetical protein